MAFIKRKTPSNTKGGVAFGGRFLHSPKAPRRKQCCFSVDKKVPDWKDVKSIRRLLTDFVQIMPAKKTGVRRKNQKLLNIAIKRARYMALLPYSIHHLRLTEE